MILKDANSRYVPPEAGAVVLMDIHTGAVISMVSSPAYDPNLFAGRISNRAWYNINEHPRVPLLNRVIAGLYSLAYFQNGCICCCSGSWRYFN